MSPFDRVHTTSYSTVVFWMRLSCNLLNVQTFTKRLQEYGGQVRSGNFCGNGAAQCNVHVYGECALGRGSSQITSGFLVERILLRIWSPFYWLLHCDKKWGLRSLKALVFEK